jgi:hypothetical protein
MSIGELDETGYNVHIKGGVMSIHEPSGHLLAKIGHAKNQLYLIQVNITQPVCLAVGGRRTPGAGMLGSGTSAWQR